MAVKHILKDGTVLDDITGHIVKEEDAPLAYMILKNINKSIKSEQSGKKEKSENDAESL